MPTQQLAEVPDALQRKPVPSSRASLVSVAAALGLIFFLIADATGIGPGAIPAFFVGFGATFVMALIIVLLENLARQRAQSERQSQLTKASHGFALGTRFSSGIPRRPPRLDLTPLTERLLVEILDEPDDIEPPGWLVRAAESGEPDAMVLLGRVLLRRGQDEAAEGWLKAAAAADRPTAMMLLGVLRAEFGDYRDAQLWLERAAGRGAVIAMRSLAALNDSLGNIDQAARWWQRAARRGDRHALDQVGVIRARQGRLEEATRLWAQAAEAGDPDAMNNLAVLLAREGDLGPAIDLWREAASHDEPHATFNLGLLMALITELPSSDWRWALRSSWQHSEEQPERTSRAPRSARDANEDV